MLLSPNILTKFAIPIQAKFILSSFHREFKFGLMSGEDKNCVVFT
jgi:hypothetical protein